MALRRNNSNRNSLSGVFLPIGELLGIRPSSKKFVPKVMVRPTWKDERNKETQAGLSSEALLIHVDKAKSNLSDVRKIAKLAKAISVAADQHPRRLLKLLNSFQNPPTLQNQQEVTRDAKELNFVNSNNPDYSFFIPLLILGALVLMSGCPVDTCPTDGGPCSDTGTSTS